MGPAVAGRGAEGVTDHFLTARLVSPVARREGDIPRTQIENSVSDQVIRENPASRGTETSAEVLVGPPWRMVSNEPE